MPVFTRLFTFSRLAPAAAALSLILSSATSARANGRFPTAQQIAVPPNVPNLLVMMATFGVNWSRDNGQTWAWSCEQSVGYQSNENPVLGVTQNGSVVIGTFEGIGVTTDDGCTWTLPSNGVSDPVKDLVVSKSDPHTVFFVTSAYLGVDDARSTFTTRVWVTHDDGATITPLGANLDPDILVETIEVAPSDGSRVYLSGSRISNGALLGVLLASKDGGATLTEADFPLDAVNDRQPYIAAVDPSNPDRVYIRQESVNGTRLLVSDDGAQTVRAVWQAVGDLLGFALSADGTKVYAGGPSDGLHVASSTALDFTQKTSAVQVDCLALDGDRLLACSNEASGFTIGATTDDGASWTPLLHLSCIQGPLACASSSAVALQCDPLWAAQQATLGGPDPTCTADAGGAVDAGARSDAGASGPPSNGSGGGCALSSGEESAATPIVGAIVGLGIVAMGWRRKKRR